MRPELNLPRDITRKIVNAAFALCMSDGGMARDASMKLLGEAFAEANAFAEKLGRDGMRFCRRCERPVDKDGVAHPLGSSGQICATYGHVFDENEPSPSPWANAGKLIDAAELAGKVGSFEDLVKLCLDESTDTGFYAISEGDSVFSFTEDSVRELVGRIEKAERKAAFLRLIVNAPDPAPCRNCGRVVLAGPACCEKPDIPPYETPIADLIARTEKAEANLAAALAALAETRREREEADARAMSALTDRVLAKIAGAEADRDAAIAERDALRANLSVPTGQSFVTCSGSAGSDGRCQECGQMVANSAGSHMRLVGGG